MAVDKAISRVIERLRALSSPTRFTLYLAGAVLLFSLSLGVGAAVAFVAGGRLEMDPIAFFRTHVPGGDKPQESGPDQKSENVTEQPAIDDASPEDDAPSTRTPYSTTFTHRAADQNSRGDYTYVTDPSIDGDANAVVVVSTAPSYAHNVGVWYEPTAGKWAIFNQDLAGVTAGSAFKVRVPRASAAFVHEADLLSTAGNYTYIDNKLTNGKPRAVLTVTQNWNPGGGRGVYNDHPIGTQYDAKVQKWAIYNRDGASMPQGAAFNVVVSTDATVRK